MNVESWGWNRHNNESRWSHYHRLMNDHFSAESKDLSFVDLNPAGLIRLNEKVKT